MNLTLSKSRLILTSEPNFLNIMQSNLASLNCSTELAALDFDNTCIVGDIGESTFEILVENKLLTAQKLPLSCRSVAEIEVDEAQDLTKYYKDFLRSVSALPRASCKNFKIAIYRWLVLIMQGLSLEEVLKATTQALAKEKLSRVFTKPHFPDLNTKFIKLLAERGFDIWIISASNPWSVRAAVNSLINPVLQSRGLPQIKLSQVVGLSVWLQDRDGKIISDWELIKEDKDYVDLVPARLRELKLTDKIFEPCSAYEGKASICREFLPKLPLLAAGDSENDLAMLDCAKIKVWFGKNYNFNNLSG